jgi:hypothetical protein
VTADVFRCDYCGQVTDLRHAMIFWTETGTVVDGDRLLHVPAVYCSPFCGRSATAPAGSGRG